MNSSESSNDIKQQAGKNQLYNMLFRSSFLNAYSNSSAGGIPLDDPILKVILQSWFDDAYEHCTEEFKNLSLYGQTYNDIDIDTH